MAQKSAQRNTAKASWRERAAEAAAAVPEALRSVPGIERNLTDELFYNREYPPQGGVAELDGQYTLYLRYEKTFKDYTARMKGLVGVFEGSAEEPPTGEPDPDLDVTEAIRSYAVDECGFVMCGFAELQRRYIFKQYRDQVRFSNVISLAMELEHESVQHYPSLDSLAHELDQQAEMLAAIEKLRTNIRSLGYRVQNLTTRSGQGFHQPFAVQAGMGQMGANGQLLAPFAGSRMLLATLTTEAPVRFDEPFDYGIPKLCEKCQVCVQRCPGRALTKERVAWRGVRKFKTLTNRCYPIFVQYDACSVCMKVCPVQKYGYDAVMDHFKATGEVLGKGTEELEGYDLKGKGHFGPGKLPVFQEGDVILRQLDSFGLRGDHGEGDPK